jgi:hypothetical protein
MKCPIKFLLVPPYLVLLVVAADAVFIGLPVLTLLWHGLSLSEVWSIIAFMQVAPIAFIAALYGGYRILSTHPLFKTEYCLWLANSPWRPGMPLPLGPIHLAWQDGLAIAFFALFCAIIAQSHPAIPIVAMIAAYLLPLFFALAITKQSNVIFAMGALLPLILYIQQGQWWLIVGLLAMIYFVALYGLQQSLHDLPWKSVDFMERMKRGRSRVQFLGWPFNKLNGYKPPKLFNLRWLLLTAILFGWSVFAMLDSADDPAVRNRGLTVFEIAVWGCGAAGVRLLVFCLSGLPPLSLIGRIVLGRPIIPGYDRIFLAPMAIAATAIIFPRLLNAAGLYPPLIAAVSASLLFVMLLSLPPRLRSWELAGHNRMLINPRQRGRGSPLSAGRK